MFLFVFDLTVTLCCCGGYVIALGNSASGRMTEVTEFNTGNAWNSLNSLQKRRCISRPRADLKLSRLQNLHVNKYGRWMGGFEGELFVSSTEELS